MFIFFHLDANSTHFSLKHSQTTSNSNLKITINFLYVCSMKRLTTFKNLSLFIVLGFTLNCGFSQVPNGIQYQAAVRNSSGQPLASQAVKVRFSIRNNSANGTVIYQETQNLTTTAQGMIHCVIGTGTVVAGAYPTSGMWAVNNKFLQVEIDPAGGNAFTDLGTTQMVSVPYAHVSGTSQYATNAGSSDTTTGGIDPSQIKDGGAIAGQVLKFDGTNWIPDVDNSGGSGGSDNWGTQTVITNTTLSGNGTSGNALRIAQQGASMGQVLKWTGSTWSPAKDSTGGYTGGNGITISGASINSTWTANGNDISNNNTGNVGIGNTNPGFKLDVGGDGKFNGNLGVGGTSPDNNFNLKSAGSGNREILLDATGNANYSGLQLRSSLGTNDYITIRKYGLSASGTFTDGTPLARSGAMVTGNSASRMVVGSLGTQSDLHLMTASMTRLQIDKDGNMYSGTGTSPGSKLHLTKGTNGFVGPTGSYFAPSLSVVMDTTVKGFYSSAVTGYAAGKLGAVGGFFSGGRATTDTIQNYGVYGEAYAEASNNVSYAYGAFGYATGSRYNYGNTGNAIASRANTLNIGTYGYASGDSKGTTSAYGVYGFAEKASTNYAGYFGGLTHVNGTFTATTKTFLIDHPLDPANKYLQFTCIESPDMMNIYNGNVVTDANGFSVVTLPDYFEAANIDFKYQLTVVGQFAQAIIKEKISENKFTIQTDKPNVEVSWQVTGVRNDEYAKQNRIVPVYEKSAVDKGKYLHPEVYKLPAEQGIHYIKPPAGIQKKSVKSID